jgi:phosphoserine phosphatase RsbU/P
MNCGQESPLLIKRDGTVMPLLRTGPAVGVIPKADFTVEEITFQKNDFLLAFTDGIPDAINTDQAYFGKERLLKIIESDAMAPESLLPKIKEELHQFIGTARQFDDITLLEIIKEG